MFLGGAVFPDRAPVPPVLSDIGKHKEIATECPRKESKRTVGCRVTKESLSANQLFYMGRLTHKR